MIALQVPVGRSHSKVTLLAHVVWATRDRAPVLQPRIDAWLSPYLATKAAAVGAHVVAFGAASDHVHILVSHPSSVALAALVHRLKGASAHDCNVGHLMPTELRWQPGYWAESVSPHDEAGIARYVRAQRTHHAGPHGPEPWEREHD